MRCFVSNQPKSWSCNHVGLRGRNCGITQFFMCRPVSHHLIERKYNLDMHFIFHNFFLYAINEHILVNFLFLWQINVIKIKYVLEFIVNNCYVKFDLTSRFYLYTTNKKLMHDLQDHVIVFYNVNNIILTLLSPTSSSLEKRCFICHLLWSS